MNKTPLKQKCILIFFALFLFLILLELGLGLGGFIFLSLQEYRNRIAIKQKGTYRIICLGESTTAFSFGNKDDYPYQLEEILNQRNIGIKFTVINKGVPGVNITTIVDQLEDNLNQYKPDMVITMIGVNDEIGTIAYTGIPAQGSRAFFNSLKTYKLIKLLKLHIINNVKELGIYRPEEKREAIASESIGELQSTNIKEQEAMYKEALERNPGDDEACVELGGYYREQGKYFQAEAILKQALALNPQNERVNIELAKCYNDQAKYTQAETMFKKILELSPQNEWTYIELARCYRIQGKHDQAKKLYKQAIELSPQNEWTYIEPGGYYRDNEEYEHAEEMLKQALKINSQNEWAYFELAKCYRNQGKYTQAEAMFKQAIEINPQNAWVYIELGLCYRNQGKYTQAEAVFKQASETNPKNVWAYLGLAHCCKEQGKYAAAEEYTRKAKKLRLEYYNPITRNGYQKLKEILTEKEIKLVSVQYPMRSVEPLK
ncbi:MAG: tetratricopeptide repeat protein, partial [Candidatus Omnitrophota bacterium]